MDDDEYYSMLMEDTKEDDPYHELSTVFSSFEDTVEFKGLVEGEPHG